MRRFFKQLFCAILGHGGMTPLIGYDWRCKKCGKIVNLNPWNRRKVKQ